MSPAAPVDLIREARAGDVSALNTLLEQYRPYLRLLARMQKHQRLQAKFDDSDLVQEVSVQAFRDFAMFAGGSEGEFAAWLRSKMAGVAAHALRRYSTRKRNVELERDLAASLDQSSFRIEALFARDQSTPSAGVIKRERSVAIARALEALPAHYRDVVMMRDFKGLSLEEISAQMNRSPESVRKLWARAIVKLRLLIKDL